MKTDTEIRANGLRALVQKLGVLDAERFIALIQREPFDYTEWQADLWPDRSVEDLSNAAMSLRKEKGKSKRKRSFRNRPKTERVHGKYEEPIYF